MNTTAMAEERLHHPRSLSALRTVKALVTCYFGVSIVTLVAIILLRNDSAIVTPAVWIRGSIVATSAFFTVVFAAQMARGSKSGYLRLRIVSAVMLVAVVAIIALPGVFPLWLKLEQGICGLLLLGVVVIVNSKRLRLAFAKR